MFCYYTSKYNFITKKLRFLAWFLMRLWVLSVWHSQVTVTFLTFFSCVLIFLVVSYMGELHLSALLLQQVFHYYTSALDLIQLVNLADLPGFLVSRSECELYPWNSALDWVFGWHLLFFFPWPLANRGLSQKSVKAKLLLDQLKSLRGKVIFPQTLFLFT